MVVPSPIPLVILFVLLAGQLPLLAQKPFPPKPKVDERFIVARHVPSFPGCEDLGRGPEKKKCEEKMLQRFIYDNLVYPELAKKKRMEGTAIVRFYVEKDGTVSPQRIIENPGQGMGEEAMRLLKLMNLKGIKWSPSSSNFRNYRTLFHLSIEFSLKGKQYAPTPPTLVQILERTEHYPWKADTISIMNSAFLINRIPDLAPVFPGADTILSSQEQQQYTRDQLRAYFKANFKHQNAGVHLGGQGDFMVKLLVGTDGRISATSVDKDPGGGIAAAAVRVVNQMVEEDMRWQPGKKDRRKTAAEISIPISLIPKGDEALVQVHRQVRAVPMKRKARSSSVATPPPPPPPPPKTAASKKLFWLSTDLKAPPRFPGCEDIGSSPEQQQCATAKLDEFIQGNLRYPAKAAKYGTSGTALVSFIVEKDGQVSNAKILHNPGAGTGKEALRLVKLMSTKGLRFSPQKSGGRAMRVQYTLPVKFEINKD